MKNIVAGESRVKRKNDAMTMNKQVHGYAPLDIEAESSWTTAADAEEMDPAYDQVLKRLQQWMSSLVLMGLMVSGCFVVIRYFQLVGPFQTAPFRNAYIFILLRLFGDLGLAALIFGFLWLLRFFLGRTAAAHAAAGTAVSQKAFSGILSAVLVVWGLYLVITKGWLFFRAAKCLWQNLNGSFFPASFHSWLSRHVDFPDAETCAQTSSSHGGITAVYVVLFILTIDAIMECGAAMGVAWGALKFIYHKIDHKLRRLPLVEFHRYDRPDGYVRVSDYDGSLVRMGPPIGSIEDTAHLGNLMRKMDLESSA